jgi:hypothetical protein
LNQQLLVPAASYTTPAQPGALLHCAQQSAALAPGVLQGSIPSPSMSEPSITWQLGGARGAAGGAAGGRALGSSPSGEPLGCADKRSTPATQPLEGQEGLATRLWSSSTTVCITTVAYTPVEVFKIVIFEILIIDLPPFKNHSPRQAAFNDCAKAKSQNVKRKNNIHLIYAP